jgi:hypothetical protein
LTVLHFGFTQRTLGSIESVEVVANGFYIFIAENEYLLAFIRSHE